MKEFKARLLVALCIVAWVALGTAAIDAPEKQERRYRLPS
jgi:hypothetical protein